MDSGESIGGVGGSKRARPWRHHRYRQWPYVRRVEFSKSRVLSMLMKRYYHHQDPLRVVAVALISSLLSIVMSGLTQRLSCIPFFSTPYCHWPTRTSTIEKHKRPLFLFYTTMMMIMMMIMTTPLLVLLLATIASFLCGGTSTLTYFFFSLALYCAAYSQSCNLIVYFCFGV